MRQATQSNIRVFAPLWLTGKRCSLYLAGLCTDLHNIIAAALDQLPVVGDHENGSAASRFASQPFRNDAHPSALSGGQKQRLAIACAIFSGRRILILDEPTSGLDGQNMRLIAERLKSEARNGRTILVITHDRELIESCCDNVVEVGT